MYLKNVQNEIFVIKKNLFKNISKSFFFHSQILILKLCLNINYLKTNFFFLHLKSFFNI